MCYSQQLAIEYFEVLTDMCQQLGIICFKGSDCLLCDELLAD